VPTGAVKLKNWKSEKLNARSSTQIARVPDFQDFRFSPTPATSETLPTGLGLAWAGWGCERPKRQVYSHNRTFSRGLYNHWLNGKEQLILVIAEYMCATDPTGGSTARG
jgi:hypothetical protein